MRRASRPAVTRLLLLAAIAGCASDPIANSPAPLLDTQGGSDQADRDCNVILRQLLRVDDGGGSGDFTTAGSSWVFVAEVEISTAAAAEGMVPSLLYQSGDPSWHSATGVADPDGATPGYVKYAITLDEGVPGPTTTDQTLNAIPYLPLAGGGRLFDHNRNPGDLSSYSLDQSNDFSIWAAPGTCQAPTDARGATLTFTSDWQTVRTGVIVPGGTVTLAYDVTRAPTCRGSQWDVTAHVAFANDTQQIAVSVDGAAPSFVVPTDGATELVIYFENTDASGCTAYDSNLGANYTFAVETPPPWLGLPTDLLTRDPSNHCAGGGPAANGFTFDDFAREQDDITNLCFQVWKPGVTDTDDSDLWQQLDSELHWRLVTQEAATPWTTTPVGFDARVGNNAQYALDWRQLDPYRDDHCPELAGDPTSAGLVQIQLEYYISVNGGELRPEAGATFVGNFADFPTNAWRTANCP